MTPQQLCVDGPDPFLVTRKGLEKLFGSPDLVRRMIKAQWLTVVREGGPGRETLYSYKSAEQAFKRLKEGEEPSSLASKGASKNGHP